MSIDEIRSEYPEANGCSGHPDHILGPWSPLMTGEDPEAAVQAAQCLRCGYVNVLAYRISKETLNEGLQRGLVLSGLTEHQWAEKQDACGNPPPDLG